MACLGSTFGGGRGGDTYKYYMRNKFSHPSGPSSSGGPWVGGRTAWTEHLLDGWMDGYWTTSRSLSSWEVDTFGDVVG